MILGNRRKAGRLIPAVALLAVGVAGCNHGGDTTCSDFRGMSLSQQKSVVQKLLEQKGAVVSPLRIDVATLSAKGYCFSHDGSAPIKNIYGG